MRSINDFHNILHMDVVLLRVESDSKAVVLPSIYCLVPYVQNFTVHVQNLKTSHCEKKIQRADKGIFFLKKLVLLAI